MQDNAPAHKGKVIQADLAEREIEVMKWPPFSPDLNPIENVWNWMKDWIEDRADLGREDYPSYEELRAEVMRAWEVVPTEYLKELPEPMPQRCKDVLAAGGGSTKW